MIFHKVRQLLVFQTTRCTNDSFCIMGSVFLPSPLHPILFSLSFSECGFTIFFLPFLFCPIHVGVNGLAILSWGWRAIASWLLAGTLRLVILVLHTRSIRYIWTNILLCFCIDIQNTHTHTSTCTFTSRAFCQSPKPCIEKTELNKLNFDTVATLQTIVCWPNRKKTLHNPLFSFK